MSKSAAAVLLASLGAADAGACVPADQCPMLSDGLYCPVNDVTEHADSNRDVAAISALLYPEETGAAPDYAAAKIVYTDGQESSKGGDRMRTLQGLAQKDMTKGGDYTNAYYTGNVDLYGAYSDVWDSPIVACLDATGWCASKTDDFRRYIITKGLIGVVAGYATYEMGAAVYKAEQGELDDDQAPYAWDEAAAFYIGNIDPQFGDGITGSVPGNLYSPYEFTWKRDTNFPEGVSTHTVAVPIFNSGLRGLRGTYDAQAVANAQESIYKIMSIAAIRSAIRYSYKATDKEKYVAEGAMYWRFASGYIASVSPSNKALVQEVDAIFDLTTTGTLSDDKPCLVKTKVEAMYADLGITCQMVGDFEDAADVGCGACDDGTATGELSDGSSDYGDTCMASTTADDTGDASDAFAAQIPGTIAMAALAGVAFATAGRP